MTFSTDHFVRRYFEAVKADIISDKHSPVFSVRLPIDVDKELTHRPYYWMYVESLGQKPEPTTVHFVFDTTVEIEQQPDEELDYELITMGSLRFHNILNSARRRGRIGRLYQYFPPKSRLSRCTLRPYLLINMKVSLIADKTQDHLYSLGINLQNGQLYRNFYNNVKMFPLTEVKPHDSLLGQPAIDTATAVKMMEEDLYDYVTSFDNQWAVHANQTMLEEIGQIEEYYDLQLAKKQQELRAWEEAEQQALEEQSRLELDEQFKMQETVQEIEMLEYEKKQRTDEVRWQFHPRVEISPYSMVMVYMV